jgi:hypothetical protein
MKGWRGKEVWKRRGGEVLVPDFLTSSAAMTTSIRIKHSELSSWRDGHMMHDRIVHNFYIRNEWHRIHTGICYSDTKIAIVIVGFIPVQAVLATVRRSLESLTTWNTRSTTSNAFHAGRPSGSKLSFRWWV